MWENTNFKIRKLKTWCKNKKNCALMKIDAAKRRRKKVIFHSKTLIAGKCAKILTSKIR